MGELGGRLASTEGTAVLGWEVGHSWHTEAELLVTQRFVVYWDGSICDTSRKKLKLLHTSSAFRKELQYFLKFIIKYLNIQTVKIITRVCAIALMTQHLLMTHTLPTAQLLH